MNEYTAMHPPLTKRIEALRLFYNSQIFCDAMGMDKQSHLLNEKQLAEKTEALIAVLGKE